MIVSDTVIAFAIGALMGGCGTGSESTGGSAEPSSDAATADVLGHSDASRGPPPNGADATTQRNIIDASSKVDVSEGMGSLDAGPACVGRTGPTGDTQRTVDGRTVLVHVPPTYDVTRATPIIVALHGLTNDPAEMSELTHYNIVGDQRGWIVAYPAGVDESWNAGVCCAPAEVLKVDDVDFIRPRDRRPGRGLLRRRAPHLGQRILQRRVHDAPARVRAVRPSGRHRGRRRGDGDSDLLPRSTDAGRPGPRHVRSVGPVQGDPILGFPSTATTMEGWAARNACTSGPTAYATIGDTTCEAWSGCKQDASVKLCTVKGGVHDWFGGGGEWTEAGVPPPGFVATTFLADFFEQHPWLPPSDGGSPSIEAGAD